MAEKYREVREALLDAGWMKARVTGSHVDPPGRPTHDRRRRRQEQSVRAEQYAGEDPTTNRTGGSEVTTYAVIYERADDGGWWARAAEFPVYSHGDTREEAEQEVRAGILLFGGHAARGGRASSRVR